MAGASEVKESGSQCFTPFVILNRTTDDQSVFERLKSNRRDSSDVTSTTVAGRASKRAYNFNAGPAAIPVPVLEKMRDELIDYHGTGMSVMELSHRSAEFEAINDGAEKALRRVLRIPDEYSVLFLQGGGSMQFAMAPMNLYLPGRPVDVLHTGTWTAKAIGELKKGILHNIAASTESEK